MLNPTIVWAQRDDYVWLTVEVSDSEDVIVDLTESDLKFRCKSNGNDYGFDIKFFKPIIKEESKYLKHRLIDICLKKVDEEAWPRLTYESKKVQWIKVDWSKWQDSDAEDEPEAFDTSKMGGFGDFGLPGELSGLAGMKGDFSDFAGGDSDDEDDLPDLAADDLTQDKEISSSSQPLIEEINKAS